MQNRMVHSMWPWAAVLWIAACGEARGLEPAALPSRSLLPPLRLAWQAETGAWRGSEMDVQEGGSATASSELSTRKRYVLPVLLSAILPGAGEIATGHWARGLPLVGGDVATWFGYAHYQREGRSWRTRYEQYADTHWDYDRWQQELQLYYGVSQTDPDIRWYDSSDPTDHCTCSFVFKYKDRQHYYENVGKYKFFYMGWDDWSYNSSDPVNSDSAHNRRAFGLMRIESNTNFDHATSLIVVGMATRLLSVAQTVYLVRHDLQHERFAVEPRALPGRGTGIALTMRY
jgi:hypothetical protein